MKLMTKIFGNILCKVNNHNLHFSQHLQVSDCWDLYIFMLREIINYLLINLKHLIFMEKSHTEVLEGQCSKANLKG